MTKEQIDEVDKLVNQYLAGEIDFETLFQKTQEVLLEREKKSTKYII